MAATSSPAFRTKRQFTLPPKAKKPSNSTNEIVKRMRNQPLGLQTKAHRPSPFKVPACRLKGYEIRYISRTERKSRSIASQTPTCTNSNSTWVYFLVTKWDDDENVQLARAATYHACQTGKINYGTNWVTQTEFHAFSPNPNCILCVCVCQSI